MQSAMLFGWSQRLMRWLLRADRDGWTSHGLGPVGAWTKVRDLPPPPRKSFRRRWREEFHDEG